MKYLFFLLRVNMIENNYVTKRLPYLLYRSTPMFMIAASKPWVKEAY